MKHSSRLDVISKMGSYLNLCERGCIRFLRELFEEVISGKCYGLVNCTCLHENRQRKILLPDYHILISVMRFLVSIFPLYLSVVKFFTVDAYTLIIMMWQCKEQQEPQREKVTPHMNKVTPFQK